MKLTHYHLRFKLSIIACILLTFFSVCKRWNTVISNPSLWQRIDLRQLIRKPDSNKPSTRDWYWMFPKDPLSVSRLLHKYASGSLKHLRTNVTVDEELQKLIRNCNHLESLEFEMDGNNGMNLSYLSSKLRHLHLALSPSTKWRCLSVDLISFPYLQSVCLRYVTINYDLFTCLVESGNLRMMKLDCCNWQMLSSEFRLLSEHLIKLQELYLISCHFPSPSCIYGIIHHVSSKCQNLEKFELNQPFIMGYQRVGLSHRLDGILEAIGNCTSELMSLKVAATRGLTLDGLVTVITAMSNLTQLSLVSCVDVTNDYLKLINKSLKCLQFLDISGCMRLTDKGLRYLCHHKCIQELRLYGCTCFSEDVILVTIKTLPDIRVVTLPGWRGYDICADLLHAQRPRLKVKFWWGNFDDLLKYRLILPSADKKN